MDSHRIVSRIISRRMLPRIAPMINDLLQDKIRNIKSIIFLGSDFHLASGLSQVLFQKVDEICVGEDSVDLPCRFEPFGH